MTGRDATRRELNESSGTVSINGGDERDDMRRIGLEETETPDEIQSKIKLRRGRLLQEHNRNARQQRRDKRLARLQHRRVRRPRFLRRQCLMHEGCCIDRSSRVILMEVLKEAVGPWCNGCLLLTCVTLYAAWVAAKAIVGRARKRLSARNALLGC